MGVAFEEREKVELLFSQKKEKTSSKGTNEEVECGLDKLWMRRTRNQGKKRINTANRGEKS